MMMSSQDLKEQIENKNHQELFKIIDTCSPNAIKQYIKDNYTKNLDVEQDQALREIDIRIDELNSVCSNFDIENVLGWGIEERIAELQAQKDKLIKGDE